MKRRIDPTWQLMIYATVAALLASPAVAQEFIGTAKAIEDAPIYAGAGSMFYVVGKLKLGTIVKIDDRFVDWYKIVPPKGVYSYIRKTNVDLAAEGNAATVNAERAIVRAADVDGPGGSFRRQLNLFKGAQVRLASREPEGGYYKIFPPKGAYVYVAVAAVRRLDVDADELPEPDDAGAAPTITKVLVTTSKTTAVDPAPAADAGASSPPAAEAQTTQGPTTTAQDTTAVQITTIEPTPEVAQVQPEPEPVEDLPPDTIEPTVEIQLLTFEALEQRFAQARELRLEQQPIDELLELYQAVGRTETLTATEQRVVALRLHKLKSNAQLAATLRQLSEARKRLAAGPTRAPAPPEPIQPVDYDAVGQLHASGVYDGVNLPRLYRLVTAGRQTSAYVRPANAIAPADTLGRVVGVVGEWSYDPALKVRVLAATGIEVLEPQSAKRTAEVPGAAH